MDYKNYPSVVEISDLILQRVYAFQGNIISFSYFQGFCSFVLTNCNSEEIVYDKTVAISYKKNTKTFSISFDVKKEVDSNFCQIDQSELFLSSFAENPKIISLELPAQLFFYNLIFYNRVDYSTVTDFARFLGLSTSKPLPMLT